MYSNQLAKLEISESKSTDAEQAVWKPFSNTCRKYCQYWVRAVHDGTIKTHTCISQSYMFWLYKQVINVWNKVEQTKNFKTAS